MPPDESLLRQYAESGDEAAFAELVRRHTNLVYSVARRVTRNGALAEEVTQAVFTRLAQQATAQSNNAALVGWLYTNARHRAIDLVRTEARRRAREQESTAMQDQPTVTNPWEEIAPLLEEAMGRLGERDRTAIVLRYFDGQSLQQIGTALGLSENSAYRRVERALEKLRNHFARRGVSTTAAMLSTVLAANSVQAAPVGTAERVAPAALAAASSGAGGAWLMLSLMNLKFKISLAAVIILAAVLATFSWPSGKSAEAVPIVATSATKPPAASVPQPVNPVTVAMPVASPAPTSTPSAIAASVKDPQAEITTALDDIIRLFRAGEIVLVYEKYTTPADQAKWSDTIRAQHAKADAVLKVNPAADDKTTSLIGGLESMRLQKPKMNAAGDEATFELTMMPPPGMNVPPKVAPMIMVKIDGKWYLKNW